MLLNLEQKGHKLRCKLVLRCSSDRFLGAVSMHSTSGEANFLLPMDKAVWVTSGVNCRRKISSYYHNILSTWYDISTFYSLNATKSKQILNMKLRYYLFDYLICRSSNALNAETRILIFYHLVNNRVSCSTDEISKDLTGYGNRF